MNDKGMKLLGLLVGLMMIVGANSAHATAYGFCEIQCFRSDQRGGAYKKIPANVQTYPDMATCEATEPVTCYGNRMMAAIPICANALRQVFTPTDFANWTDRDLVNGVGHMEALAWCQDSMVPDRRRQLERRRIPDPSPSPVYQPRGRGWVQPGPGGFDMLFENVGDVIQWLGDSLVELWNEGGWVVRGMIVAFFAAALGIAIGAVAAAIASGGGLPAILASAVGSGTGASATVVASVVALVLWISNNYNIPLDDFPGEVPDQIRASLDNTDHFEFGTEGFKIEIRQKGKKVIVNLNSNGNEKSLEVNQSEIERIGRQGFVSQGTSTF